MATFLKGYMFYTLATMPPVVILNIFILVRMLIMQKIVTPWVSNGSAPGVSKDIFFVKNSPIAFLEIPGVGEFPTQ